MQETYEVLDTWFYDDGVTGNLNTGWWKNNNVQLSKDSNGITVTNSTSSTLLLSPNKEGTSTGSIADLTDWDNFICEFTYHEASSSSGLVLQTRDANAHVNERSLSSMSLTDGDIVKIVYTNNVLKYYKNDVQQGSDYTNCSGDVMIRFSISNNSLRFSNFKVYSV